MTEIPEAIRERIKKLLNLADKSRNDSPAEAELAAKKAQDLMLEYNLSLQQLHTGKDKIPVNEKFISPEVILVKNEGPWIKSLFFGMARINFCKAWTFNKGKDGMQIIGEPQNLEMMQYMIDQLIPRIRSLAKQSWNEYNGYEKRNTFIRGFLEGCVRGIIAKLEANIAEQVKTNQNVQGLVLVKTAAVTEYFEQMGLKLRFGGKRGLSGKSGYEQGREQGGKMSIYKGVGGSNGTTGYLT